MASSEVTWPSAYWALVGVALNTMMQPCGSVCGFDPSLQIYLRSSPFVCLSDTIGILIRYGVYLFGTGRPLESARRVLRARRYIATPRRPVDRPAETPLIFRFGAFVLGVVYSFSKLTACTGLPCTTTWAWFYFLSFIALFAMKGLVGLQREAPEAADEANPQRDPAEDGQEMEALPQDNNAEAARAREEEAARVREEVDRPPEAEERPRDSIDDIDNALGYIAIVLQLVVLAWVDLAALPPNKRIFKRYLFHFFRFGGHVVAGAVHFICATLQAQGVQSLISFRQRAAPWLLLVVFVILMMTGLFGLKYTQLYHFWSIIVAIVSWLLFSFRQSKELVCVSGPGNYKNVMAFDFFCRMLFLSWFWYMTCYNPADTSKPDWAEFFG